MAKSRNSSLPRGSAHVAKMFEKYDLSGLVPGAALMPEEVSASHQDVKKVSPERVLNSPFQHQEYIDPEEFQRLVESIKSGGFHTALYVNIDPKRDGYYFLTAGGHQRRDAATAAGVTEIPIYIEPPVERVILAFRALNENTIGVNRSPVNVGHLLHQIKEEFPELTQDGIATRIGRSRGWVNNRMIAAREAEDLQEMVAKAGEDRGLRAMMALRKLTREERTPIIPEFLAGRYTTDMVEGMAREIVERRGQGASPASRSPKAVGVPLTGGGVGEKDEPTVGLETALERTSDGASAEALLALNGASPQQGEKRFPLSSEGAIEKEAEVSTPASTRRREQRHAREAKLRDAVARLEAYQSLCDQEEEPSQKEEQDLLKARAIINARLARREAVPQGETI